MTKNENNKLEYRNAIYVGGIYENARNGLGQVLFDNSEILLGQCWIMQPIGPRMSFRGIIFSLEM